MVELLIRKLHEAVFCEEGLTIIRAPSEVLDLVGEKLTGLKRQRDHAREQLRAIETANGPATATDEAETTIARLGRLENDLLNGEPARRREVYREGPTSAYEAKARGGRRVNG